MYILFCIFSIFIFKDFHIKQRHNYLKSTFGTKSEEDRSYANSATLMISATVCMLAFCILEPALYFLYNRKVKTTMKSRHRDTIVYVR